MSNTAPRQRPTEHDWNFSADRVPPGELIPCLLWEFLRESATAQKLAQDWRAWSGHRARGKEDNQAELSARLEKLTFVLNHKLNIREFLSRARFVWTHGELANGPWQELHHKTKEWLREPCDRVNEPVFIGLEMHVGELAAVAATRFQEELARIPSVKGPLSVDEANKMPPLKIPRARARLNHFTPPGSVYEALCVMVDWGRYDDNAIRASFHKLTEEVIASRPKTIEPQVEKKSGKGRLTQWRGMLNSLGVARLRGYYKSAGTLKTQNSAAYTQIAESLSDKGPSAVQKKLDAGVRRFLSRFNEVLPFEGRPPLCLR